jgi:spermidine synthase
MGRTDDFIAGTKVLEEIESPVNGKIRVLRSLGFGTYIQVENLTQSGGVVRDVWRTTLRKVASSKKNVARALILGLGGGSGALLVRKYWPKVKITGVDIDLMMVELGKEYLGLDKARVKIQIQDAHQFCTEYVIRNTKYDLILVDTYLGHHYPKKFESEKFLKLIFKLLTDDGVAVFNRLYWDKHRLLANKFEKKLEKIFSKVERVYPEANVMFVCSK